MLDRKEKVKTLVNNLLDFPEFTASLIADGWTKEMAEAGFYLHEKTWRGIESVMPQIETMAGKEIVNKVCHVWPALPGAGVSPVLFGALCGVEKQHIKASRRGQHFASYFVSRAQDLGVAFSEDLFSSNYERLIVSGADETISYFQSNHENVIGFGHRESIAIIDSSFCDFDSLATDISQWNQQGCFSVRAVFYIGKDRAAFCQNLANALFLQESSTSHDESTLSARIHERAIREMTADFFVHVDGRNQNCAWVSAPPPNRTWTGGSPAAGCVEVFRIDEEEIQSVFSLISLPSHQRQGVALSVGVAGFEEKLFASGFTHISRVGEMQAPPLGWLHDGRSNVEMFCAD